MANKHKIKGDAWERQLAKWLNERLGIECFRTPLSGACGGSDLTGTPDLAIECKRQEAVNWNASLEQSERNKNDDEMAVVVNRRSRQDVEDAQVMVRLSTLATLYEAYLIQEGLIEAKREFRSEEGPSDNQDRRPLFPSYKTRGRIS